MSGLIDLHTHILPGLDDGAASLEEGGQILQAAVQAGFSRVMATPHRILDLYNATDDQIDQGIEALARLAGESAGVTLGAGAEYYLDERFLEMLQNGRLRTLGDSSTVLVELPMMHIPPFSADFAFKMRLKGYTPLLAHPERYNDLIQKPKLGQVLVRMGYALQLNLGSFSGMYGSQVKKAARYLVDKELATVVASDIHAPRHIASIYEAGLAALRKLVGDAGVDRLMRQEPERLLASGPANKKRDHEHKA